MNTELPFFPLAHDAYRFAAPALGWQCPACGACFNPAIVACLRCNGRGNRATNPLVDIVITPPAPAAEE